MAAGISVWIDELEIEKEISRLVASVHFADATLKTLVAREMQEGVSLARKNIQRLVYDVPQGPHNRYRRTHDLLNSPRSGIIKKTGAVAAGQVYITRQMPNFKRIYYPVFVEHGFAAGAPYEGRGYWAATVAMLHAGIHTKAALAGRAVVRRMHK